MSKIGILLPRSTYYSSIGFDLFEGLKTGLKKAGRDDICLISDNIGFGTDQQQCYQIAERFLMQENISVVLAYVSHRVAQLLRPLFLAANKILIVLDSGANLPHEWPESTNTVFHSLHNSLGSWIISEIACKQGYRKGAVVTGYYDGGYLQTHALYRGFTETGGEIVYNHATGYVRNQFSMESLQNWFVSQPDTCFLSTFSGDFVQWYFEELALHFKTTRPEVYLPPYALEETMLQQTPFPEHAIQGVAAWYQDNNSPENRLFINSMNEIGRKANIFSLLGWEAATLGSQASDLMEVYLQNGQEACRELLEFTFAGPRGDVFFHVPTRTSQAPLYHVNLKPDAKGNCSLHVMQKIPRNQTMDCYEKMVETPLENAVSGWHNSYTCI